MNPLIQLLHAGTLWRHRQADRAEIIAFRDRQLRRMVAHAYQHVSYYRRLFDNAGVQPQHLRTVADLRLLPVTTKPDLQDCSPDEILARGIKTDRLLKRKTSGSTGEPFVIWRTPLEERVLKVIRLRGLLPFGFRRGDRLALVHYHQGDQTPRLERLLRRINLYDYRSFNCMLPPGELVARLHSYGPDMLGGAPSVLLRLARHLEAGGLALRPRVVLTGAEVLTAAMREQISKAFQAPVYDTYGSHEFGLFAWECPTTQAYHFADDGVVVEVIKEDGSPALPGEQGEVVATGLHTFAMPFIRFRLGDLVVRGEEHCACGRLGSTIRDIRGRMLDYFLLPDGREVHPYVLKDAVDSKTKGWVRQYQFVQERTDRIVLRLVPKAPMPPVLVDATQAAVRQVLDVDMEVAVELLEDLELGPHGKFRIYCSLVRSDYSEVSQ